VSNYLKKRAYGNATTEDLWDALGEASNVPVKEKMEQWINYVGFPVLTVTEKVDGVGIEQSRFLSTGNLPSFTISYHVGDATEAEQNLWWIPLGIKTEKASDTAHAVKILEKKKHVDIRPLDISFYKLNDSASGVFRVNYPVSRLETLGKQIASGHRLLNAPDRISLVADAAALAISGEGSTTGLLSLTENFMEESSFYVWDELLKRLGRLKSCWYQQPDKVINGLRAFSMNLVSKKYAEVGWEEKPGENYLTSQLRPLVIREAAFAKIPGYVISNFRD
jgi:aminopeptidase N